MVDYLSMVGDSSDNIPGIRGVGPKSAVALLQAFGSLDAIFTQLDEVEKLPIRGAKSLAKKLEAGQKAALKAQEARDLSRTGRDHF